MGIPSLNYYIRKFCPNSVKDIHLEEFSGKTIVVDTSIYLHITYIFSIIVPLPLNLYR